MKKRYLMLAGILAVSVAAAGCGTKKNDSTDNTVQEIQATVTPAVTEAAQNNVVEMQTAEDDTANIKNVIGTKSDTTAAVVINNNMGSEISAIYVRASRDDGDDSDETWGSDLVNGKFKLADQDKALYYMEKDQKDDAGNTATAFDIRIAFSDEEKNECFFRQIPLTTVSEITLCMDGSGEDGIPYARYKTGSSAAEVSTLSDVKQRLGITDESDSEESDSTNADVTPTPDPDSEESTDDAGNTDSTENTDTTPAQGADPTEAPDNENPAETPAPDNTDPAETPAPDNSDDPEPTESPSDSDPSSTAQQYIGQSLDSLEAACGSPNGSDYEDEPESGKTGYHYYDTFTVSTTVDENGNEVVSGVW